MSPIEQARVMCLEYGDETFDAALERFSEGGYIYIGPDAVVLSRVLGGNTMWVWLACGANSLQRMLDLAPRGISYIAFSRGLRGRTEPKTYRFERFKRLTNGWWRSKTTSSPPADPPGKSVIG